MLFALSSNTNTQSVNPNTRVLTEEQTAPVEEDEQIVKQFNSFTSQYHRSYLTKAEYQARQQAFKVNYEAIKGHNETDFQLGINQFADWTPEEYQSILNNMTITEASQNTFLPMQEEEKETTSLTAPQSVDWRA